MDPTHNRSVATTVSQRGRRQDWRRLFAAFRMRHYMRLLFIMWHLSCANAWLCQRNVSAYASYRQAARLFLRFSYARELCWIANRMSLHDARRRVNRGMRDMSVEARKGEQPKTDEKLCISETECHPSDVVSLESTLSWVLSLLIPPFLAS